ncbi:MAG: hypothetical protein KJ734_09555 [Chloroflexi bacterium]|nr:hypothetical protein [Chloroflexota bacterium]
MIVHKFGGTSVGDARRFANVADIVIENHQQANGTVVVVSAMRRQVGGKSENFF